MTYPELTEDIMSWPAGCSRQNIIIIIYDHDVISYFCAHAQCVFFVHMLSCYRGFFTQLLIILAAISHSVFGLLNYLQRHTKSALSNTTSSPY